MTAVAAATGADELLRRCLAAYPGPHLRLLSKPRHMHTTYVQLRNNIILATPSSMCLLQGQTKMTAWQNKTASGVWRST